MNVTIMSTAALFCRFLCYFRGQVKCETFCNRTSCTSLLCNQNTAKLSPFLSSVTNKQHAVC